MTYCVALRLDAGLVFLSDSRTNAGIDRVSTFRKMNVWENPGDRLIVLMSAGNLSISQSVLQVLDEQTSTAERNIWSAGSMYEVAQLVGEAVRTVHRRDARNLEQFQLEFNTSLVVGGQIGDEACRLFQVYSAGNFIESQNETTYFQIGEAKYGKPILDRVISRDTPLDEAAKCALISMDSTLRSNMSVGMPLDLLVYANRSLALTQFVTIDESNLYFQMIRKTWGEKLRNIFREIDSPVWNAPMQAPGLVSPPRIMTPPSTMPGALLAGTASAAVGGGREPAVRQILLDQGAGQSQQ